MLVCVWLSAVRVSEERGARIPWWAGRPVFNSTGFGRVSVFTRKEGRILLQLYDAQGQLDAEAPIENPSQVYDQDMVWTEGRGCVVLFRSFAIIAQPMKWSGGAQKGCPRRRLLYKASNNIPELPPVTCSLDYVALMNSLKIVYTIRLSNRNWPDENKKCSPVVRR